MHAFGSSVPSGVLRNKDLEAVVETTDQWIVERTGIKTRFVCQSHESSLSLALESVKKTLAISGLSLEAISGIIVGTSSPDYVFPSLACMIAAELNIQGFAFDLQAACSGFVYATHIARQFVENKQAQHVLVVGVDVISRMLDWNDRKTCILFGDGCGSCLVSVADQPGIVYSMIGTQPDHDLSLHLGTSWAQPNKHHKIVMDGQKVFKKAVTCLTSCVTYLLTQSQLSHEQINLVIPHQANGRILQAVAERTSIPLDKYYQCVERYGNTSAGSIPLAYVDAQKEGLLKVGMHVMIIAFGAGMTYGGLIIQVKD
jgi:3-oxoacyl-[acyl-carrier-protein] synthase-3